MLAFHAASIMLAFDAPDLAAPFELVGNVAVVEVRGPLVARADAFCFWDSYDQIIGRVGAALESSADAIVLRFDSPGGDAHGCFEAARTLRQMATDAGKELLAYADGMMASAAYALACSATRIYTAETGIVGSIGVLQPLVDVTAQDAALGMRFAMIASGDRKLDGNPHVALSEGAIAETQGKVDAAAQLFFDLVGELRPAVTADDVKGLEARTLLGREAVDEGLADGVLGWGAFLAMVASGTPATDAQTSTESQMDDDKKAQRAWLAKMAEGDGDEGKHARALLKAFDAEFPPEKDEDKDEKKDDDKKDEKKDAKAKAEADDGDEKKAKASSEDDSKAKARSGGNVFDLTARVHALETEKAAEKDLATRTKLLASRPDFSAETKATLLDASITPLALVEKAVKTWPKVAGVNLAAAASVTGTAGETQTGEATSTLPVEETALIDRQMGLQASSGGIVRKGRDLVLGFMSPDQAKAHLETLNKKAKA